MSSLQRLLFGTCLLLLFSAVSNPAVAQESTPADAAAEEEGAKDDKGPKPYAEVITEEMTSTAGLFTVHRDCDEVYFEIPASELGKDMLWVTQIAETQAGFSWAGMPVGDRVVRWERRGDRVLLRDVKYDIRADVDDPIRLAVAATSAAPIIHVFDVAAWGEGEAPVIEVSSFFTSDTSEFSAKEDLGAEGLDSERTMMGEVKTFPGNLETRVLATYTLKPPEEGEEGDRFPSAIERDETQSGVTVVLHHSMVRLPEEPMHPRRYDDRIGFFNVGFNDYGDSSDHEVKEVEYITRWRLEKKDPGAVRSEPVKPIVWYVSREVPERWRQACLEGIEDWRPAFEAAGFKNAIVGKLAPTEEEDPDWDPEDVRYTTIRWLPSAVPNAFGPHVSDPRTGEILEADVRMFHNVIKLVRDWYFVQASPSDERAQELPLPEDLMAELVRFVVAHEVGHSLGFRHNMKASSSYTVEQLRDPEFSCKMGTAPSIMDYARFNYVAQPGDGACLMPAVGVYDHFAVEWGYRQFAEGADEKAELEAIAARQVDDPMLRFGDPNPRQDPSQQTEDLSADAVAATRLGVANLKRVATSLVAATSEAGEDYDLLENMHGALLGQWRREMLHVANVVGGVEEINLYYGDAEQRFFPIDAARQREAMAFLRGQAFATPEFLLAGDVADRLEAAGMAERLLNAQTAVLKALIDENRVKRMSEIAARDGEAYLPARMMSDLTAGIWSELDDRTPAIDLYRRNLQRAHVALLGERLDSVDPASDLPALARGELSALRQSCREAAKRNLDATTALHLEDITSRINLALNKLRVESAKDAVGGR